MHNWLFTPVEAINIGKHAFGTQSGPKVHWSGAVIRFMTYASLRNLLDMAVARVADWDNDERKALYSLE